MEVIRGLRNLKLRHRECVVTIGNFDGLHLGHSALLRNLRARGQELRLPTLVIIFEPQPNEFFHHKNIPRLMRFREKIVGLAKQKIDRVLCIRFNEAMALQPADVFVRKNLVEKLAIKHIVVGDDFRFGYKRLGDYSLLEALGKKYHFNTEYMPTFKIAGERVSSTQIRLLLEAGQVEKVHDIMGHAFTMSGKVAHGDKRGRLLGCPTANIHLHRKAVPVSGVFAVEMLGVDSCPVPGVANVGSRPTLSGESRILLEVHLLNFSRDIYGQAVEIKFLHKFREEKKFASFEDLQKQIQTDIQLAKDYHQQRGVYI